MTDEGDLEREDDEEPDEADCIVCGDLTPLRCCRCLLSVCSSCECLNGCDEPIDPAKITSMTRLIDINKQEKRMTFAIEVVAGVRAIRCLLCNRVSELAGDVDHRYCGRCHLFHDVVADGRRLLAAGGSHECEEWRTYRDRCALCDRPLPTEP